MKPEPKLEPLPCCRFCGSASIFPYGLADGGVAVLCDDCHALGPCANSDADAIAAYTRTPPSPGLSADEVYMALAHGADTHQAWLREAVDALFSGRPVPPPRAAIPPSPDVREPTEARAIAAHCLDNLAIDAGAKIELIERIVAAVGSARKDAREEAAKVAEEKSSDLARRQKEAWPHVQIGALQECCAQIAGEIRALQNAEETKRSGLTWAEIADHDRHADLTPKED